MNIWKKEPDNKFLLFERTSRLMKKNSKYSYLHSAEPPIFKHETKLNDKTKRDLLIHGRPALLTAFD